MRLTAHICSAVLLSILYLRCRCSKACLRSLTHSPSFNSLFEMPSLNTSVRSSSKIIAFQFSIWDAPCWTLVFGVLFVSFNSLFEMRMPTATSKYMPLRERAFNSLFEMLERKHVIRTCAPIPVLSILYLRCVPLEIRHTRLLYLPLAFQFSIWDAGACSSGGVCRSGLPFNSLFEMQPHTFHAGSRNLVLSILYLRCRPMSTSVLPLWPMPFNSLFEMPPLFASLLYQRPKRRYIFQFSIWDAPAVPTEVAVAR